MMNDAEFTAWYLNKHREQFELPRAEARSRLIHELAEPGERQAAHQAGAGIWLRLGLRRLGEQMIAAGEWRSRADTGRERHWTQTQ
jgi:hypothetical protein